MNINDVSVATITLARDEKETAVLQRSLTRLAATGLTVYITDGGSSPEFINFLHGFPQFIITPQIKSGVWPQASSSLQAACKSNDPFIFYTEPDKHDFFETGLLPMIASVRAQKDMGVVLASRSAKGFASFPSFQQGTETTINAACEEVTGSSADYTYGPFLLNKEIVPHLQINNDAIGWGWRPYLFTIAHRLGYRVNSFVGDFLCPPDQQTDTKPERLYRMKQLVQNIEGILLSTAVVLPSTR